MNFENNEGSLSFEQSQNNYELENQEIELIIEDNKPQATFENEVNEVSFDAPKTKVNMDYNKASNKPSINGVELTGNKTTEDLGIVETSMTEIELSTDITNPTEITNYINKSGTYVAKNTGVIGNSGTPFAILAKGQFINISNLQEYGKSLGLEIPDSQNVIDIDGRLIDGTYATFRITGNGNLQQLIWLTSENVNDYVDSFNPADFINSNYGIRIYDNKLAINPATTTDINNGTNTYKPITPNLINYAIQQKGENWFADKTAFETLQTDLTTLKTEIETILESVVSINE